MTTIEDMLNDEMTRVGALLKQAEEASKSLPALRAEMERLRAAGRALAAPAPRKPRKDKGTARSQKAPAPVSEPPRRCDSCKLPGATNDPLRVCGFADCDGYIHAGECAERHRVRWHGEVAE